jgi:hypothetical protein
MQQATHQFEVEAFNTKLPSLQHHHKALHKQKNTRILTGASQDGG